MYCKRQYSPILCLKNVFFIVVPKTAPTNVTAVRLGPHEARVSWGKIPKMNWQDSDITYIVKYKKSQSTPKTRVISSSKSNVELKELDFTSNYTVYVFARNCVGDSKESEKVSFSTNSCK